jgi:hypothetical protein
MQKLKAAAERLTPRAERAIAPDTIQQKAQHNQSRDRGWIGRSVKKITGKPGELARWCCRAALHIVPAARPEASILLTH